MPPINHVALSAGVVAVSVAVAAAIAIYESPELRRYADDIRRRIAIALHSLGDGVNPPDREPLFNRPEDAEGFLESRGGVAAEPGVDADDETRRRQREELMYWNALREAKKEKEEEEAREAAVDPTAADSPNRLLTRGRGSSFDDFLRQDESGDRSTFVFNTGADVENRDGLVRRNVDGVRGLNSSVYANPFADEHHLDTQELERTMLSPAGDEIMSDIYSATTQDPADREPVTLFAPPQLIDLESAASHTATGTMDRELGQDEYATAGQDHRADAYASIEAWANHNPTFYSPLPMSPRAPMSEPEIISEGALTPTDSVSLAGSGEDVGRDAESTAGDATRHYDVLSESEGLATPASWSEVGSVISDGDVPVHA